MSCYKAYEIERINANRPKYYGGIIFAQSGIEEKDVNCLNTFLRRLCNNSEGLSFVLVSSSTKSKDCHSKKICTKKVGRPKRVIVGQKCTPHIHCLVISQNANISSKHLKDAVKPYLSKRSNKRANIKQHKIKSAWLDALPIYSYMLKQADTVRRYGDFDFDYYDKYGMFINHRDNENYFNISDCGKRSEAHTIQALQDNELMNVLIYSNYVPVCTVSNDTIGGLYESG